MTDRHSLSPAFFEPRFTVLHLQILLHYYGTTNKPYAHWDHEHARSNAVAAYVAQLCDDGFLTMTVSTAHKPGGLRITERGRGLVRELTRVWVDEKGEPVNTPIHDKPEPEKPTILRQIDALRQTIPPESEPNEHLIANSICDLFESIYTELTGRIDAHRTKIKEHEKTLIQIMMGQMFGMGKDKPDPLLDTLLSVFRK